jgi:formylglycine-generating enzyme required for sulfatase activity
MRKLDALGVDLPVEYAFMKAKALLETGDAAGAEEQAMGYLRQAGAGGAHYKEALRLLTQAKKAKIRDTRTFWDCATCPEMVIIPAGNFMMGGDGGKSDEKPVHRVDVPAFAIGKTEVTQGQWLAIMGSNPSHFKGCDDCPVEQVNWHDAQDYLNRLSSRTGQRYRLPSEAEWEYACRAGGRHEYCGGDSLGSLAWYDGNSGSRTQPVARKQANAWGLHDMSGNVWEWVQDCWNGSYSNAPNDGSAWTSGKCDERVLRGGSWINDPAYARAAGRGWSVVTYRGSGDFGFRPARIISP